MNDTEVNKTIQQMVRCVNSSACQVHHPLTPHSLTHSITLHRCRFIKQEAEEKASEIMVAAEEEVC